MPRRLHQVMAPMLGLLLACRPEDPELPAVVRVDGEAVAPRSVPLAGGAADDDERWLVAADVDGDRIVVLDLASGQASEGGRGEVGVHEIVLPAGWAPTRVAVDAGRAAVLLQGTGAVATIELATLTVEVAEVCPEPRGVDVLGSATWVTCRDGDLVRIGGGSGIERVGVVPELGDLVVDADGTALVAVQRSAEVLRVELATGEILDRWTLPAPVTPDGRTWAPRALRRLVPVGDGRAAALYQAHTLEPIPLALEAGPVYGTGACDAVARPLVAWVGQDGPESSVRVDAVLPVELVFWEEGDGAFSEPTPLVGGPLVDRDGPGLQSVYPPSGLAEPEVTCVPRVTALSTEAPVVGAGVLGARELYAVTRAPFGIEAGGTGSSGGWRIEPTEGEPDPGFALLHTPAPAGVTCATCHVDGRDDGHTWQFEGMGPRRTQSLAVALVPPFHWDGSLLDLPRLLADTGEVRMGLPPATAEQAEALGAWLADLVPPAGAPASEASARGEALFDRSGCAECHRPPGYTGTTSEDVGTGGLFQVPSLLGVSARLPLMHTGCAETLAERFDPACGGAFHGPPTPTDAEIADLVAFLDTL